MLEKIRDVASNIPTPATLHPPYHLIWRIVHGFLWVHVHEIHNASEGRQKAHFDPEWGHLERGRKSCQKKFARRFHAAQKERAIHTFHKKALSVLINKHITRDRKAANNSAFYIVLQKQSFSFLTTLCLL